MYANSTQCIFRGKISIIRFFRTNRKCNKRAIISVWIRHKKIKRKNETIILGLFLNTTTLTIILIAIIITFLYSYKPIYLKKKFIIGNFSGAILYGLLCPLAGWSLYSNNPINITIFFFLFILCIGLSFVKDFEDLLGDRVYEVASLPVIIGKDQTTNSIILIEIFAFSIIAFAIVSETLNIFYSILLFILIPLIFYTNKFRQTKSLVCNRKIFYKILILILVCETTIIILNLI